MKNKAFDKSHYTEWRKPEDLIPYAKNAKQHDEKQVKNIATSIRRFGWQQEAVITSDNVLVIGHGRRLAAIKLGCEIPVKVIDQKADDLTEKDIQELRIADNKTNESPWDFELLADDLQGLDFEGFDFEFGDFLPEPHEETTEPTQSKVDTLPESTVYVCAVSAFGTDSESIIEIVLDNLVAEKILQKIQEEQGTQGVANKLREALNDL